MRKNNIIIILLLMLLILAGCSEQENVDANGKNNKSYESNLNEVEKSENEAIKLSTTNDHLPSESNDDDEIQEKIRELEDKIYLLESIIEEKKKESNNDNEAASALSTEELRKMTYEAAVVYQEYFLLSNFKAHGDIEKGESDIYKINGENNDKLDGYYLVTEENIDSLADLKAFLGKYYTRKAISNFLKINKQDDMIIIKDGNCIEYNGMLFTRIGGGIGVLPDDQVRFDEAQFEFCGVTSDGGHLIYKMILPTAHYNEEGNVIEKVSYDESFIELVKDSEMGWQLDEFIMIDDYIKPISDENLENTSNKGEEKITDEIE